MRRDATRLDLNSCSSAATRGSRAADDCVAAAEGLRVLQESGLAPVLRRRGPAALSAGARVAARLRLALLGRRGSHRHSSLHITYLYSLTHSHTTRSHSVHNAQLYDIVRYKYKCNYCTLFLACLFQTLPGDRRVGGMRIVSNRVVTVLCAFCFSLWLLFVCLFFLRVAVIFNFCDCLCRNRRL